MSWRLSLKHLKVKREKSTSDKGHYVRNADLLPAVIEAKKLGYVTQKLSRMFFLIAERYSRKYNFIKYSFRDDMVSAAVTNLCHNALKFDSEKYNNPFSYYTTAIHNSFIQYINDEKKHRDLRDALLLQAGSNPSFAYGEGDSSEEMVDSDERYYAPEPDLHTIEYDPSAHSVRAEQLLHDKEITNAQTVKVQYEARLPGQVTVYGPGDFTIDENGNYVMKPKETPPPAAKKAARKTTVKKAEVTVSDKPKKAVATKKVAVKKAVKTEEKPKRAAKPKVVKAK